MRTLAIDFPRARIRFMQMRHEYHMTVPSEVIDENGHTNNVAYVAWMQDAAIDHSQTWKVEEFMKENGATWFARRHEIEYLRPLFEKDALVIRTWIASAARVKSLRKYEFYRDEVLVARGETEWVHVDVDSGKPKRIPAELMRFVDQVDGA